MADVITRLKVESSEYDAKIKRAAQSLNEMSHAAEVEGNKIATANKENLALVQTLGKMQTVSTTAKGKMSELSSAIESATVMYNRLSNAEKQGQFGKALNASITQLQTRLVGIRTEMAAVQGQMAKTGAVSGGMGIGAQFGAGLKSAAMMFGPQALAIGGVMAAYSGLKKVMGDMVGINRQFEQSHANLAAVMGKTRDETEALATQAKQLGATTQWTATQILDLQTNLARLGFTENEILNSTAAVQALATATRADLGEAANLAGAALRGFGLDASEMDRVASVLAVSTTKSALSFEKLATAVPIVAPVARQFGFSIEDTVALLGKLSDAGMDASMAATATRNIFLKMADSGGKLSQAMGRPVHSVEEFGEALKEMKEKGMSLNDILKMVGVRSTAAFAVFADNADKLKDFKESITGVGAELDKMVAEQLNTLEGSVTIMKSAWDGLMLSFSNSNGTLKQVTDALGKLLQEWTKARNLVQGGEAAIGVYKTELSNKDKQGIREKVDAKLRNGSDVNNIIKGTEEYISKLKDEEKELVELSKKYEKFTKDRELLINSGNTKEAIKLTEQWQDELKGTAYTAQTISNIYSDIGNKRNKITQQEFVLSYAQSKLAPTEDPNGKKGDLAETNRANIEAEIKRAIADLDKVNMIKLGKEEEYEDQVYQIKKAGLERIRDLYAKETKEYAQVDAQLAQLDIQYQNTKIRLAKQADREIARSAKQAAKEYTGYGDFNEESIAARIKTSKSRQSKMEFGSQGYMIEANKIVDLTTFQNLIKTAIESGIELDEWDLRDKLMGANGIDFNVDIPDSAWEAIADEINAKRAELGLKPIILDVQTGGVKTATKDVGKLSNEWVSAAHAVAEFGSALQSVEDPTAKIAGIIAQAIASVAAGAGSAIAQAGNGSAGGPWGWVAFAISATATMISTIAAIKSVTSGNYASGGIIPGNSYSGDNQRGILPDGSTIGVNAGELILSRSQQSNIAAQLSAGDIGGGGASVPFVTGENIILGVNNFLGRSGRGEIVTTSMLRRAGINL